MSSGENIASPEAEAEDASIRDWLSYLAIATESIGASLDLKQVAEAFASTVTSSLADHVAVFVSDHMLHDTDAPPAARTPAGVRLIAEAGEPGDGPQVVVPLQVRGDVIGTSVWTRRKGEFTDLQLMAGRQLAAQAALSMHDAFLYRREAATVDLLQRDMLAITSPDLPGAEIVHRYLPGNPGARVGGDWFDTIRLRGGRVALIVGDVAGHGIQSAAAMGRLRTAMRTLATLDLPEPEVLRNLDNIALAEGDLLATCVYCVYDPVARICSVASAGHVPPVLYVPGEPARILDVPPGAPIGVGGVGFEAVDIAVPDGSLLVLCTDGLVERRDRDLSEGLDELCGAVMTHLADGPENRGPEDSDLGERCDRMLDALGTRDRQDDVAVVAARLSGVPADRIANWVMTPSARTPGTVRGMMRGMLSKWKYDGDADQAVLLTTELVTNAVRYAHRTLSVRLMLTDGLLCEVQDDDHRMPVLADTSPPDDSGLDLDESGRGIFLVSHMARRWGVSRIPGGKVVWFEM